MLKEFKEFINKGNIVDLAVAMILGLAFNEIVKNFVEGILNPLVALVVGEPDFKSVTFEISGTTFKYGLVVQAAFTFIMTALALFFIVKAYNQTRKKEEEAPAAPAAPTETELLTEIRDLLKK